MSIQDIVKKYQEKQAQKAKEHEEYLAEERKKYMGYAYNHFENLGIAVEKIVDVRVNEHRDYGAHQPWAWITLVAEGFTWQFGEAGNQSRFMISLGECPMCGHEVWTDDKIFCEDYIGQVFGDIEGERERRLAHHIDEVHEGYVPANRQKTGDKEEEG